MVSGLVYKAGVTVVDEWSWMNVGTESVGLNTLPRSKVPTGDESGRHNTHLRSRGPIGDESGRRNTCLRSKGPAGDESEELEQASWSIMSRVAGYFLEIVRRAGERLEQMSLVSSRNWVGDYCRNCIGKTH